MKNIRTLVINCVANQLSVSRKEVKGNTVIPKPMELAQQLNCTVSIRTPCTVSQAIEDLTNFSTVPHKVLCLF